MCKWIKHGDTRIDPCMRGIIGFLIHHKLKPVACCCGHGKYPMTLVIDVGFSKGLAVEIFSGIQIKRKKRFYKKDKEGYYYIPETLKEKRGKN